MIRHGYRRWRHVNKARRHAERIYSVQVPERDGSQCDTDSCLCEVLLRKYLGCMEMTVTFPSWSQWSGASFTERKNKRKRESTPRIGCPQILADSRKKRQQPELNTSSFFFTKWQVTKWSFEWTEESKTNCCENDGVPQHPRLFGEFKHQTSFATQTQTQRNIIVKPNQKGRICHAPISHWPKNLGYVGFEFTLQITFGA